MTSRLHHLYLQYGGELQQFFGRRVGRDEAPDLVNQTYLHWLEYPAADAVRNSRAFLFTIAANLARDSLRRRQKRAAFVVESPCPEDHPASAPTPEAAAESSRRFRRFEDALGELPEPCRRAFLLSRFQGMTHTDIATCLGISKKTVERYIARAAEHCASRLEVD